MLRLSRGTTLIELMIGLAVLGVLIGLAIPAFETMLKNYQIRTAAEALVSGLQTARTEAVRRNTNVRFQLVNTLGSDCNPDPAGANWLVSRNDPTAKCDVAEVISFVEPNDTSQPQILQKRPAGSTGTATSSATSGGAPASFVVFNSLGRVAGAGIDTINVINAAGGNCEHDATPGKMRCMRIRIGAGGQVKMCDPKVTVATDSRYCS